MRQTTLPTTETCPFCAEDILTDARTCKHCGESLDRQAPEAQPIGRNGQRYSNAQAPWRLMLLSIATFSLYDLYWFYRNWKQIKLHERLDIRPGWRTAGLFVPIYSIVLMYRQFKEIQALAARSGEATYRSPGWVTFGYVVLCGIAFQLSMYSWKLTDPAALLALTIFDLLLSVLTVGVLVMVQLTLNRFWKHEYPDIEVRTSFSRGEMALLIIGGLVWGFGLIGLLLPTG
jgi:hypothetical protein